MKIKKVINEINSKIAEEKIVPIVMNQYDLPIPENQKNIAEIEDLIKKKREIEIALEVVKEHNLSDKISHFEEKLSEIKQKIAVFDEKNNKIFDNPAIIYEERAAILEFEGNFDKNEAKNIAFSEYKSKTKKPVESPEILEEKLTFWHSIFNDKTILKESELIERMLLHNKKSESPANNTYQLNEIFKAEYEGILANTSESYCSNHIYRIAK